MKQLALSVVIPVYNEEKYIKKCLDALLASLKPRDEVIIVNNNSTDKTAQVVKKYGRKVRLLNEKKQGQVFAQRKGFMAAKNSYVARIDADSIVEPNWRDVIATSFKDPSVDAISGPGTSYDVFFKKLSYLTIKYWLFKSNRLIAGFYPMWGSNFVVRRQALHDALPLTTPRPDIWEDIDLAVQLWALDKKIQYVDNLNVTFSNRNGVNQTPATAIRYQLRAPKTYYISGLRLVSVLSFVERLLMLSLGMVPYLLERTMQAVKHIGRYKPGYKPSTWV